MEKRNANEENTHPNECSKRSDSRAQKKRNKNLKHIFLTVDDLRNNIHNTLCLADLIIMTNVYDLNTTKN